MNPEFSPAISGNGVPRFVHPAMATTFEVMIADEERTFAEQCAFAAFEEIDRLEQDLSRFLPNSDITRLNNLSPGGSLCVGMDTFECLKLSKEYSKETSGAFDITVGTLMDRLVAKDAHVLPPSTGSVGMHLFELDEPTHRVIVGAAVPRLDLGAIGKGYAVDRACDLLKEWGISNALVHGGGSSAFAFGDYPGYRGWPVTVSSPWISGEILQKALLRDVALSGSGVMRRQHIVDPKNGVLSKHRAGAWVSAPSAARSDAISTACMVMNDEDIEAYCSVHTDIWVMVTRRMAVGTSDSVVSFGVAPWERPASA